MDTGRVYGWDKHMKRAVEKLRPELVDNLIVEDLLDNMHNVFPYPEYITAEPTSMARNRKFLNDLEKRTAKDFWIFVSCLYLPRIRQGHLAELILCEYERGGGVIKESVRIIRDEFLSQQRLEAQNVSPTQQQQLLQSQPPLQPQEQQHQQQRQLHNELPLPQPEQQGSHETGNASRPLTTETGAPLCSELGDSVAPGVEGIHLDVDDDGADDEGAVGGGEHHASIPEHTSSDGRGASNRTVSKYEEQKQSSKVGVFKMETNPRGAALIINNWHFQHIPHRDGTKKDCDLLHTLFRHKLLFEVEVKADLKGEAMKTELRRFAAYANGQKKKIDCIMVAILTHGLTGDVLLGVDGQLLRNKLPKPGTFITKENLKEIFSVTNCPGMEDKPKLFIIQACRGDLEDTCTGQRRVVLRDIVPENPECPPSSRKVHDRADQIFLHATVDNFIAYRNNFIEILVEVFQEHAEDLHFAELHTMITQKMKERKIDNCILTIPDPHGPLSKLWYFNPPPVR